MNEEAKKIPICPNCGNMEIYEYTQGPNYIIYVNKDGSPTYAKTEPKKTEWFCTNCNYQCDILSCFIVEATPETAKKLLELEGKERILRIAELMADGEIPVNEDFLDEVISIHEGDNEFMVKLGRYFLPIKL